MTTIDVAVTYGGAILVFGIALLWLLILIENITGNVLVQKVLRTKNGVNEESQVENKKYIKNAEWIPVGILNINV